MRLALAAVLLVVLFPLSAVAASDNWLAFFSDTADDAASGANLSSIWLGNSDDGAVTFQVNARYAAADAVRLYVDAGGDGEADLRIDATNHGKAIAFAVMRSGKWVTARFPDAFTAPNSGAGWGKTVFLSRRDLGNATAIDVWAESSGAVSDRLPDRGAIHYDLRPLTLRIDSFTPVRSALGMRLELKVRRSDSGDYLLGALPLCHGTVAGKAVFAKVADQGRASSPAAFCDWRFAKKLRGKQARATIMVPYAGRAVSRTVSFTIR